MTKGIYFEVAEDLWQRWQEVTRGLSKGRRTSLLRLGLLGLIQQLEESGRVKINNLLMEIKDASVEKD